MAAALPPLSWTCPQCGQPVPAGQANCPTCSGAGAPQPQPPPRPPRSAPPAPQPAPAPALPAQPRRAAPANPPAQPPAPPHGTRQQYCHPVRTNVGRDENWVAHRWYQVLLVGFTIGCLALLLAVGLVGRWTAPKPTPPAARTLQVTAEVPGLEKVMRELTSDLKSLVGKFTPAVQRKPSPAPKPDQPSAQSTAPAPQQVQVSGSLDLFHHEAQAPATAQPAERAGQQRQRPSPKDLEEMEASFFRWAEGRDP